jgi:hypothetical protein
MNKDNQADIFNMLHDGLLYDFVREEQNIKFKVNIPYLASLINSSFNTFSVTLIKCSAIYADVFGEQPNIIRNIDTLSVAELEILSAKEMNDKIEITCTSTELGQGYGAILAISTEDIIMLDEDGLNVSETKLEELCRDYWKG